MEHRKLDCLETLTRGSYCSATQQNKPFQLPISYLVVAMIVPLGFKNLHKLPRLHSKVALLQIARQICDKCRTGCKEYL